MCKNSSPNVKGASSQAAEEISFIEVVREGDSEAAEVVRDQKLEVDVEEKRDQEGETKEMEDQGDEVGENEQGCPVCSELAQNDIGVWPRLLSKDLLSIG